MQQLQIVIGSHLQVVVSPEQLHSADSLRSLLLSNLPDAAHELLQTLDLPALAEVLKAAPL